MSLAELIFTLSIFHTQRWRTVYFQQFLRYVRLCDFPNQMIMQYSSGWQTLLEQYKRDENVRTLLQAMHDAFDFAHHEDIVTLKSIKPRSDQARTLALMLGDVCSCCDFIQSYAKDSQFCTSPSSCLIGSHKHLFLGKRTLKNIGGGPDEKIKRLSNVLVEHRTAFLNQATISTEITVFEILDNVGNISTQLQDLLRKVSDAGRWSLMASGLPIR
jgi:hypothetical protein